MDRIRGEMRERACWMGLRQAARDTQELLLVRPTRRCSRPAALRLLYKIAGILALVLVYQCPLLRRAAEHWSLGCK
jgi:hypothetical protein